MDQALRRVAVFQFPLGFDAPDIEDTVNRWIDKERAVVVNTSMAFDSGTLFLTVVYEQAT